MSATATTSASGKDRALTLRVDGMSCGHCEQSVAKSLQHVEGVTGAVASAQAGTVSISYRGAAREDAWRRAISDAGYTPLAAKDETTVGQREARRARRELLLLVWSVIWTIPVLIFAHGGHLEHRWALWVALICATVLQLTSAITYYAGAIRSLRRRQMDMDVLVSLGVAAGYVYAVLATLWPGVFLEDAKRFGDVMTFYEAATLLICFIRLGKWIEARSRSKAASAMDALLRLAPERARKLGLGGAITEIAAAEVHAGDRLVVLPGDAFAVDGIVEEGESSADEALISGESIPVAKAAGAKVIAGSVNGAGRLIMRATGTGPETTLARIVRLVEEAQSRKAPIQRVADRISNVFVPAVVLIAIASGLYWGLIAQAGTVRVLTHMIGVIVIACPCALGVAVPAAIMIGSGAGLRKGILVRDGGALERLSSLTCVVLDKTGTITEGKPRLERWVAARDADPEEVRAALPFLMTLARASTHPLSRATAEGLAVEGIAEPSGMACELRERSGRGSECELGGARYRYGSRRFLEEEGVNLTALLAATERDLAAGASVSYFARDSHALAAFCLRDPLRAEAKAEVQALRQRGVRVVLLSGDHEAAARTIAREAGIDEVIAQASPEDKIEAIRGLQAEGQRVGMVGDGVNDAPALAQADVGIAIGGGTDAAREAGGLVLMSGGIANLNRAFELSRRTLRGIRGNLAASLVYNVIGIPLAAGLGTIFWAGLILPPGYAALAMVLSDASVALNSLWLGARLSKV